MEHNWINRLCIDLEDEGFLKVKYCIHCTARQYLLLPAGSAQGTDYRLLGTDPDPLPEKCPQSQIRRPQED